MASILESLKITNPRDSHFSRKFWNTFIDKLAALLQAEYTPSYLVYSALLNKSGMTAPIPTVLENTLGGTPVFETAVPGIVTVTLTGSFTVDKTYVAINNCSDAAQKLDIFLAARTNDNVVTIASYLEGVVLTDVDMVNIPFEIRVYN